MRGFGSIRKRGERCYLADIRIASRRVRRTFPSRALAERWIAEMRMQRVEVASGAAERKKSSQRVTYAAVARELMQWWRSGLDRVRTTATLRGYSGEIDRLLEHWGARIICETTERDVARYGALLREHDLASSTIRNLLSRLAQIHAHAVRLGYLASSPCAVQRPAVLVRSSRTATQESEIERALEQIADHALRVAVLLAADAGLRAGEIVRLRAEDVGEQWITVAVRSEIDRPKSGRARRVPILTDRLALALGSVSSGLVVPLTYNTMHHRLRSHGIRLHELRHRFATRLLSAGEPLLRVQGWLGHADARTTQGYAHVPDQPSSAARGALEWAPGGHRAPGAPIRFPSR